jgi:hypothetical protein
MPKDKIKAMYKVEGAGFLNVSARGTGYYNEVAIKDAERSYTPESYVILHPLIASLNPLLSNFVSSMASCQIWRSSEEIKWLLGSELCFDLKFELTNRI